MTPVFWLLLSLKTLNAMEQPRALAWQRAAVGDGSRQSPCLYSCLLRSSW